MPSVVRAAAWLIRRLSASVHKNGSMSTAAVRRWRQPDVELLEDRMVPATHPLTAIAPLHSNPNAAVKIHLDFDGHFEREWGGWFDPVFGTRWGENENITTPAFDNDGDRTTFSDDELAWIESIHARVAEDFAPFNVDVTTVDSGDYSNGRGVRVVVGGNSGWYGDAFGVAQLNSFTNAHENTVFIFAETSLAAADRNNQFDWMRVETLAQITSHETGHAFGLEHQGGYVNGEWKEYYYPNNGSSTPIMGRNGFGERNLWWKGPTEEGDSPEDYQDDMAVIARAENGFGYRTDEPTSGLGLVGAGRNVSGIIGYHTDTDTYMFTTEGRVTIQVAALAEGRNLNPQYSLYDLNGRLLASVESGNSPNAEATLTLQRGTYSVVVGGHGTYGDAGQYTLSVYEHNGPVLRLNPVSGELLVAGAPGNLNDSITLDVVGTDLVYRFAATGVWGARELRHSLNDPAFRSLRIQTGDGNDTVTLLSQAFGRPVTIDGGAGADTLVIDDRANSYARTYSLNTVDANGLVGRVQISSLFGPTINPITYQDFANLTLNAGRGWDTFNVQQTAYDGVSGIATTINAGEGSDTVNVGNAGSTAFVRSLTVNGEAGANVLNFNNQSAAADLTYTLTTPPTDGTRASLAVGVGLFSGSLLNYSGFSTVNLNAGSGRDTFNILRTLHGAHTFVNSGTTADTINVGDGGLLHWIRALTVDGQGNNDSLTFNNNNENGGKRYTLGSSTLQISTLTGVAQDSITFRNVGSLTVNGGIWSDQFRVTAPPAVALTTTLNGGGGFNLLHGSDAGQTFVINALNAGTLGGTVSFTGMTHLQGGLGHDRFSFVGANPRVQGYIDGGLGSDTLDYSGYTATSNAVSVNLSARTATLVPFWIAAIDNAIGGSGNDTLIGDGLSNVLVGGAGSDTLEGSGGPDILIGGTGVDTLRGGAGSDIVIGGSTSFDTNTTALLALQAEWNALRVNATYERRIANLSNNAPSSDRSNLNFFLRPNYGSRNAGSNATVLDDGVRDNLQGDTERDWFFANLDNLTAASDEQVH